MDLTKDIPDRSIDMILCDLPYGTTACKWDSVVPFHKLWHHYERIIKDDGAVVLFGSQPFTSMLIMSNLRLYKYSWIWDKGQGANFITSHYQPLRVYEEISVFGKNACAYTKSGKTMKYNPQFTFGKPYKCVSGSQKQASIIRDGKKGWKDIAGTVTVSDGKRYPTSILRFSKDKEKYHPTQKPVALLEYLVKTYTNEGDTVFDNCMGSGSTGVACVNTNRNFIGIEIEQEYYEIAKNRIADAIQAF